MASESTVRNWNIAGVVLLVIAAAVAIVLRAQPAPLTKDPAFTGDPIAFAIANEQQVYAWNWTNWTATDWIMTILAAGTAIGAAVKNAFSAHNQVQAQSANTSAYLNEVADATEKGQPLPAPRVAAPASNGIDKWVMALAALTIIATTLDSKCTQACRRIGIEEAT
jgi:hypothetical protein